MRKGTILVVNVIDERTVVLRPQAAGGIVGGAYATSLLGAPARIQYPTILIRTTVPMEDLPNG